MITLKELIKNINFSSLSIELQTNGLELLKRINIIRDRYGKPMYVTSGYRSLDDHIRVYREKLGKDFDIKKVPMGSQHLKFAAVDIYDKDGSLYKWCKANPDILEEADLYCEDDPHTPRQHFQIYPPKSGKRWFLP